MITIRPILPSDYECWNTLYADYALFYQVKQTKEMRDKLWTWLHDANHEVNGLLLNKVKKDLRIVGASIEIKHVSYEFQRGGNEILIIKKF